VAHFGKEYYLRVLLPLPHPRESLRRLQSLPSSFIHFRCRSHRNRVFTWASRSCVKDTPNFALPVEFDKDTEWCRERCGVQGTLHTHCSTAGCLGLRGSGQQLTRQLSKVGSYGQGYQEGYGSITLGKLELGSVARNPEWGVMPSKLDVH
jgi:hypothetical protein